MDAAQPATLEHRRDRRARRQVEGIGPLVSRLDERRNVVVNRVRHEALRSGEDHLDDRGIGRRPHDGRGDAIVGLRVVGGDVEACQEVWRGRIPAQRQIVEAHQRVVDEALTLVGRAVRVERAGSGSEDPDGCANQRISTDVGRGIRADRLPGRIDIDAHILGTKPGELEHGQCRSVEGSRRVGPAGDAELGVRLRID